MFPHQCWVPTHALHAPSNRICCHSHSLTQRSSTQHTSVDKSKKQIINLRGKICLDIFPSAPEGSRLLENTACFSSQPPASLFPLQLSSTHLPQILFFFCTVLSDHFVLVYEIDLCVYEGCRNSLFLMGFVICRCCGAGSTSTCQGLHTVFITDKLQCGLRHAG